MSSASNHPELRVAFADARDFLTRFDDEITHDHLLVKTQAPPPEGTTVKVALALPHGGAPIGLDGIARAVGAHGVKLQLVWWDRASRAAVEHPPEAVLRRPVR